MHDPRLGRFFAIDPLSKEFPWNSPYAFSENRVIDAFELEGLEIVTVNKVDDPYIWSGGQKIKDKSAIHIIAHGSPAGFRGNNGEWVDTKSEFEAVIKTSDQYEKMVEANELVVVLHSCRTGRPADKNRNGQQPVAQKMSKAVGAVVIAPDERDYFGYFGESGPHKTTGTDQYSDYKPGVKRDEQHSTSSGNWMVYTKGVLTAVYRGGWDPVAEPSWSDKLFYQRDLKYTVTANSLNVRTGPGAQHSTNGDPISKGTKVTPTGNVDNGWLEVEIPGGRVGWISAKYTKAEIVKPKPPKSDDFDENTVGCFLEGEKVLMSNGEYMDIQNVVAGDSVKTFNLESRRIENKVVLKVDSPIRTKFIEITFENDTVIKSTWDHPYFVKNKGWASYDIELTKLNYNFDVEFLRVGDVCMIFDNKKELKEVVIKSISEFEGKRTTYNLSRVQSNNNFFVDGVLVHNKFIKSSGSDGTIIIDDVNKK